MNPEEQSTIYDAKRNVMMAYDGWPGPKALSCMIEYDGVSWRYVESRRMPPPRSSPSLVFDPNRGVTVLVGGWDHANKSHLGDTWQYDGVNWKRIAANTGRKGSDPLLVYHPLRDSIISLGGTDSVGGGSLSSFSMWELKDGAWRRLSFNNPEMFASNSFAYWDPSLNRIVVISKALNEDADDRTMVMHSVSDLMQTTWIDNLVTGGSDYSGDGTADIAVWNPTTGAWRVKGREPVYLGKSGDTPVPGDYNGDGALDCAVWRRTTGDSQWIFEEKTITFGGFDDIPVPADYDGDGSTDIAVFDKGRARWEFYGRKAVYFGLPADVPVPADYNGDGRIDLATYSPITSTWHIQGIGDIQYGEAGCSPAVADYDGDGRADIGVWNPRTRVWLVREWSTGKTLLKKRFGSKWDIPVPGDFDGDGKAEPATFTPAYGRWNFPGKASVTFGALGDVPLARGN
jgi:uncharacterized cupin superfamily protein